MDITVAIAEDDRRYRSGLETLFSASDGFEVGASFGSAFDLVMEAEARARAGRPLPWDLVLTDLEMPHMDGIEATRRLKAIKADLPVVVVTVFEDPATILDAICAGADGYLLKRTPGDELIAQLEVVLRGGATLTPGVARTVLGILRRELEPASSPPTRLDLTDREQEVLRGLVDGLAYKQIAAELGISLDTVRTHIRSLYKKLQVQNAAAAVSRAVREGLV